MKACGSTPCGAWATDTLPGRDDLELDHAVVRPVNGPPDYVGIYITISHPWITGLFGH